MYGQNHTGREWCCSVVCFHNIETLTTKKNLLATGSVYLDVCDRHNEPIQVISRMLMPIQ